MSAANAAHHPVVLVLGAARTMAHALAEFPVCVVSDAKAAERIRKLALRHDVSSQDVRGETGEPVTALTVFARKVRAQMVALGVAAHAPCDSPDHSSKRVLDGTGCDLLVVKAHNRPVTAESKAAPAVRQPT